VVDFVEPEGYLVTRYVEGEVGRVDVGQVGRALRRLHAGPAFPARFDSFRVVELYRATALERGVSVPAEFDEAKEVADGIERRRAHADALHVGLPGGHVGRRSAGDLRARLRLPRVRPPALRAPRADRGGRAVPRGAPPFGPLTRRGQKCLNCASDPDWRARSW